MYRLLTNPTRWPSAWSNTNRPSKNEYLHFPARSCASGLVMPTPAPPRGRPTASSHLADHRPRRPRHVPRGVLAVSPRWSAPPRSAGPPPPRPRLPAPARGRGVVVGSSSDRHRPQLALCLFEDGGRCLQVVADVELV